MIKNKDDIPNWIRELNFANAMLGLLIFTNRLMEIHIPKNQWSDVKDKILTILSNGLREKEVDCGQMFIKNEEKTS